MSKILSKDLPKHFWTEESGLTSILILLCISNFIIIPFFEKGQVAEHTYPCLYGWPSCLPE